MNQNCPYSPIFKETMLSPSFLQKFTNVACRHKFVSSRTSTLSPRLIYLKSTCRFLWLQSQLSCLHQQSRDSSLRGSTHLRMKPYIAVASSSLSAFSFLQRLHLVSWYSSRHCMQQMCPQSRTTGAMRSWVQMTQLHISSFMSVLSCGQAMFFRGVDLLLSLVFMRQRRYRLDVLGETFFLQSFELIVLTGLLARRAVREFVDFSFIILTVTVGVFKLQRCLQKRQETMTAQSA